MVWLLCMLGVASATERPVSLGGGLVEMAGDNRSVGGGVVGLASANLGPRVSLDFSAREALASRYDRVVGTVLANARVGLTDQFFVHGGFTHNHETHRALYEAAPVQAALGSLDGIEHRSGVDLGAGVDFVLPMQTPEQMDRMHLRLQATGIWFPDQSVGPNAYVVFEQLFVYDIGKPRR